MSLSLNANIRTITDRSVEIASVQVTGHEVRIQVTARGVEELYLVDREHVPGEQITGRKLWRGQGTWWFERGKYTLIVQGAENGRALRVGDTATIEVPGLPDLAAGPNGVEKVR